MKKKDIDTIRDALILGAHVFKEFLMHDDWDLDHNKQTTNRTKKNLALFKKAQQILKKMEPEDGHD